VNEHPRALNKPGPSAFGTIALGAKAALDPDYL